MMRAILVASLALLPFSVAAQSYLPQPSLATCLARSAAQCQALGCDGVNTVYWWPCQVLTAPMSGNTSAIVVQPGDPAFGVTTTNNVAKSPTGLSPTEQSALKTRTAMGTALPDIVATPNFIARFTAAQKTAITQSAYASAWTAIQGAALVDLSSASVQVFLANILAAGIITQANYTTIMATTAVLVSP